MADFNDAVMTGTADNPPPVKRLTRDPNRKMVAGVCSGVGRYFGLDPALVRLLFVLSFMLPGPQILLYIAAWIIVPQA